ncbi:MAG: hypothetical protein FWB72_02485 [Firmicutes bacterium]|nr:hypothetical protein [Bacillota bacterium]
MIFYDNKSPRVAQRKSRTSIRRFGSAKTNVTQNLLPLSNAWDFANVTVSTAGISTSFGIAPFAIPDRVIHSLAVNPLPSPINPNRVWHYPKTNFSTGRVNDFLLIFEGSRVRFANLNIRPLTFEIILQSFTSVPTAIFYRLKSEDVMIFYSATDGVFTWNGTGNMRRIANAPALRDALVVGERTFALTAEDGYRIWFSEDLDPTNFNVSISEGGFIDLVDEHGPFNKLVSIGHTIYIIRSYGIARLNALGDQRDFTLFNVYSSTTRIYEGSVAVCGNVIVFLAEDGLYMFDGTTARKIFAETSRYFARITNHNSVGCYHNGKYYLSCHATESLSRAWGPTFSTISANNALFQFDLNEGVYAIVRGHNITSLNVIKYSRVSILACTLFNVNVSQGRVGMIVENWGRVFEGITEKWYLTGYMDFDAPDKYKILNSIDVTLTQALNVTIVTESDTYTYRLGFSQMGQDTNTARVTTLKLNLKFKMASIRFHSSINIIDISNVKFNVSYI